MKELLNQIRTNINYYRHRGLEPVSVTMNETDARLLKEYNERNLGFPFADMETLYGLNIRRTRDIESGCFEINIKP